YPSSDPRAAACLVRVKGSTDALAAAIESNLSPGPDDSFNISPVLVTATKLNPDIGAPETNLEEEDKAGRTLALPAAAAFCAAADAVPPPLMHQDHINKEFIFSFHDAEIKDLLFKMWYDQTKPTTVSLLVGDYHQLGVWMACGGKVVAFDPAPTLARGLLTSHRIEKEGEEKPEPEPEPVPRESTPVLMVFASPGEFIDKLKSGRLAQNENFFLETARDNQDAAMSVVAIVVDHIEPHVYWKPALIDAILKYGDRLYSMALPAAANPPRVCAHECPAQFHLTSFNVSNVLRDDVV
ncbi:hypothetical protein MSG28_015312, partial [Choristoneura fumiferana]